MRILAMTNLYPNPYQPHRATFNRHQFRILGERHPIHVIAPILWTDERRARRSGGCRLPPTRRVVHDELTIDHPRYWYTPKLFRGQYGRFFLWSVRNVFQAAISEFRPDIVFAPWAYPDGWAAVRLAHRAKLPVVLQVHGSDIRLLEHYAGRQSGTAEALQRAEGVVAVSRELADRVVQLGADPRRIQVIIDGVDRQVFSPADREAARAKLGLRSGIRHLLFVGNLLPVKGLDVLLQACTRLENRIGPWELHLIGSGAMQGQLVRQAARAGLSDRVRFQGPRPHSDLPDWYRAADLFVLPSRSEGIPNVLLEAAACGTPFVATRVGGIPEIAHFGASRLVPPEDCHQLAEAIVDSLLQPAGCPAAGPRDRQEAVAELEKFFLGIVEHHAATRPGSIADTRIATTSA
jgi:glycosyltransferase involved in cell wall biosynthesis